MLRIEEQFEDIIPGKLKPESNLGEIFNWNPENEKIMIDMLESEYDIRISSKDFHKSGTFQDLFNIISLKAENKQL